MTNTDTQTGWAAVSIDVAGEAHDIGGGWQTEAEARLGLIEQGADMDMIEIFPAVTDDDWDTWDRF